MLEYVDLLLKPTLSNQKNKKNTKNALITGKSIVKVAVENGTKPTKGSNVKPHKV
jgi:hypothetical protein